ERVREGVDVRLYAAARRREGGRVAAGVGSARERRKAGRRGAEAQGAAPARLHKARPRFKKPAAVVVTWRVARHVWNVRSRRCFEALEAALPMRASGSVCGLIWLERWIAARHPDDFIGLAIAA